MLIHAGAAPCMTDQPKRSRRGFFYCPSLPGGDIIGGIRRMLRTYLEVGGNLNPGLQRQAACA